MASISDREATFRNIVRLRRAEDFSPNNPEIRPVRLELEALLGDTVTPTFAARVLGVSHTALGRWIERGDVPVVFDVDGRRVVPVSVLTTLYEETERQRASGSRHALESAVLEGRERAGRLRSVTLLRDDDVDRDAARVSELRSLAYHRAVGRRLDRATAEMALALVRYWREQGRIDRRYAEDWERILQGPLPDVRKVLEDESPYGRDLRQSSPFAGILSEAERTAINENIG